jgi:anti-anti-sigma factor
MNTDKIQEILDVVMKLAAGELDARGELSGRGDEMDALMAGVNMLAEEFEDRHFKAGRLLDEMTEQFELISAQRDTILSLSTPAMLIWEGVLVLPVIGTLDTRRAALLAEDLLKQVVERSAEAVIIDITGIHVIDTAVAGHLLRTFSAVRLLGAKCILSGVRPAQAQVIAGLGVALDGVITVGSLHDGLKLALRAMDQR